MRRKIPLILFLALLFSVGDLYFAMPFTNDPFWEQSPDAAMFERIQNNHLAQAQTALERMLQVNGKRTITNSVGPFDEVLLHLDAMDSEGWLMANVHPDSTLRNAGEKAHQKSETFRTALLLNRKAYDALATLDLFGADSETRYYIEKMLLEFRLAGVEKGPKVHTKIKALRDELVTLEQEFARNIKDDSRT